MSCEEDNSGEESIVPETQTQPQPEVEYDKFNTDGDNILTIGRLSRSGKQQ